MRKNSVFISLINGLDIKVQDKKVLGEIHKIKWDDAINLSSLIRQCFEKLYPQDKVVSSEFLGLSEVQTAAGIELTIYSAEIKNDEINCVIYHLLSEILSNTKNFSNPVLLSKEYMELIQPLIENFKESNTRKKISNPILIKTETQKITISGEYKKIIRIKSICNMLKSSRESTSSANRQRCSLQLTLRKKRSLYSMTQKTTKNYMNYKEKNISQFSKYNQFKERNWSIFLNQSKGLPKLWTLLLIQS